MNFAAAETFISESFIKTPPPFFVVCVLCGKIEMTFQRYFQAEN